MLRYKLTLKAVDDLTQIWNYTFEVWSENQADKYYNLLVLNFIEIAKNPYIGRKYTVIQQDLFGFLVGKHIVFYRIVDDEEIEIVRILHQQMDINNKI